MLWLLCALSDTQRRRAFAACAGSECRGSRAGAAHNGHGFLASVWLFPTWVSQHASLLKPSVVCAWSGRCAVMRGPRKQGWWLQSSVWRRFSRSLYGKWICGVIRADVLVSALSCFPFMILCFDCLRYGLQCVQIHKGWNGQVVNNMLECKGSLGYCESKATCIGERARKNMSCTWLLFGVWPRASACLAEGKMHCCDYFGMCL